MAMNLNEFRNLGDPKLPKKIFKLTLIHILLALDFLHSEAKMIHTDLQQKNIRLKVEDESILSNFESDEMAHPSPRKINGDHRVIYVSRELGKPKTFGRPGLADFGEARFGADNYEGLIQPFLYRAPEVVLHMPWTEKVDIWNTATLAWDLFENKHFFYARDTDSKNSSMHLLAEMIALLGLHPVIFFDEVQLCLSISMNTRKLKVDIPVMSLENSEKNLEGKDKVGFLTLMRKMMRWVPADRLSAKELLQDPWLSSYENDDDV